MLLRYGTHKYTQKNIHKLDMIQRRAARYACNRYHNISSVTDMVGHLGWEPLTTRRRNMRLCMMYKIAHTVVGDPWTEWLTTTKRVTRGFHAWKYIPIYSQHNIYKFSFLPRTIIDEQSITPSFLPFRYSTSLLGEPGSPSIVVLCGCAFVWTMSKICVKEVC